MHSFAFTRPHPVARMALRALLAVALVASAFGVLSGQPAAAVGMTRSQNIALVPSAGGQNNFGGTLPTTISGQPGVPSGYAPTFTTVLPATIMDGSVPDPLIGFDTVVLVGICDIATKLADADFKSRIEGFVTAGGKVIIWDSECQNTNYNNFVYPFTTNNPGAAGANGVLTDVEENTLSSTNSASSSFVNDAAVSSGTDAVGDANVFVTFNQNWCVDLRATNVNGVVGPVQTYARLGSGLIIYDGLDKDFMGFNSSFSNNFDPTSTNGQVHLQRIWLLQLLQPFNPDNLPCGIKAFGLSLSPKTATNPPGTSHTVTAHLSTNEADVTVTFSVTAGPNTGKTGTAATNSSGNATFTYTSNGTTGTDTITATATISGNDGAHTQVSDTATKIWGGATTPTAPPSQTQVSATSPSCGQAVIEATGVTPGLPHQIVVTPSTGGTPIIANVSADASQKVGATIITGGGTFTVFVRMTSNQVTVSNTVIFTVAPCVVATPTPTPTPATPTPKLATPTPTPAPIAQLPSTATGGDSGLPIAALAAIAIALAAFALRRYSRT